MEHLKKATVLAAFAVMLIVTFGAPAPAAAGCSELCHFHTAQCNYVPNQPTWGCGLAGNYCYDVQCEPNGLTADAVEKIAAAAEAGDLEQAQKLAADYPTLRIMKPGKMLFDGPQLAGIPGPEASPEDVHLACASPSAAAPASALAPAPVVTSEK